MGMNNNHWRILQKHNRHLRHQFVRQFMPYFLLGIFFLFTFIFVLNSVIDTIINAKIMGEIGKSPTSNAEKQPIFWKNNEFVSYEKERRNLVMPIQLNSSKPGKVWKRRRPRAIGNESNANCDRMKNLANESAHDSPFPSDLFNIEQRQKGAIILHFFGLIYMFVALAIVCDEYFVPSLGVITEMLDISDDVAGATFMAAGGSAPEFFTSLFGTFITQNNVGVGTIVGSATFNILCVLAFCTIFSRNVLILTWWPLFRDIIFYSLALFLLSIFFFDELVEWPEALAMFIFYLFYAIFMKYNSTIENAVKKRFFAGTRVETKDIQTNASNNNAVNENGIVNGNGTIAVENHSNKTISKSSAEKHEPSPSSVKHQIVGQQQHLQQCLVRNSTPILHAGAHYPQIYPGIVQVALGNRNHFKNEMTLKTDIPRIVRKRESADHIISHHYRSRQQKDESKNENYSRRKRFNKANSLPAFNHLPPMASITPRIIKVMAATSNANSTIGGSIHQPKTMHNNGGLPPVNTITMPMMNIHQGNNLAPTMGTISPLATLKEEKKLETNNTTEQKQMENDGIYSASTTAIENESTNDASNDDISLVENGEFTNYKNKNEEKIKEELAQTEEDGQPIDLSWPKTFNKQCIFLLMIPIMIPLYYTLPDVKKEESKKYAAITFIGSVLWIAFFTYLMVWWASVIGQTLGLPTEVIGLTILAAGTSIPDLITSVIVSRKGLADMAVSSSIGSNLFDICVGLPLPWLLHFIIAATQLAIGNDSISVKSNGLMCSIGILFMMLIVLIVSVAISKWKMDKLFGTIMLIAYILFCIFSILLEKKIIICPLKIVSKC